MESTRIAIVTAIEALRLTYAADTSLVVEYDNRIAVDPALQVNPYLAVQIKFIDGFQVEIANNPLHRLVGQVYLVAWVKENTGSSKANLMLEHFYKGLQRKQFGAVRLRMAVPTKQVKVLDWVGFPVILPFWTDQAS